MANYQPTQEQGGGYGYRYREPSYVQPYTDAQQHPYSSQVAQSYAPAPSAQNVYGQGNGEGRSGSFAGGLGGNGQGGTEKSSAKPTQLDAITPSSRAAKEGYLEAAYGLVAQMLKDARPRPLLIPGIAYGPFEGAGADATIFQTNRAGARVSINVGFIEPLITGSAIGLKRIGRNEFRPAYGIVTYQTGEVNRVLSGLKRHAQRRGNTIEDRPAVVHTSAKDIRETLDHLGILPQDAAASILFALADSGRKVKPEVLQQAVAMGVIGIGAEGRDVIILPTTQRVFKIHTGGPYIDQGDIQVIQQVLPNISNVDEVFDTPSNRTKAGRKLRAVEVELAMDTAGKLHIKHYKKVGKKSVVIDYVLSDRDANGKYTLQQSTAARRPVAK